MKVLFLVILVVLGLNAQAAVSNQPKSLTCRLFPVPVTASGEPREKVFSVPLALTMMDENGWYKWEFSRPTARLKIVVPNYWFRVEAWLPGKIEGYQDAETPYENVSIGAFNLTTDVEYFVGEPYVFEVKQNNPSAFLRISNHGSKDPLKDMSLHCYLE